MDTFQGNLFDHLSQRAARSPHRLGISWHGKPLTWLQVEQASRRVAEGLLDLGVKQGDRVAVMLPNIPPYLFVKFGVHLVGAVLAPVHILTRGPELGYQLSDCEAKVLISWAGYREVAAEALSHTESLQHHIVLSADDIPPDDGLIDFTEWLINAQPFNGDPVGGGDEVALIRYTAGVTGRPKGAMISHANVLFNSRETLQALRFSPKDKVLGAMPFYHPFGCTLQVHVILQAGSSLFMHSRFDPEEACEQIAAGEVTAMVGLPVHFAGLVDAIGEESSLGSLRLAVCGGGPLSDTVINRFEEKFKTRVAIVYGTCETSPTISVNAAHLEDTPPASWGRPISGVEVRIVSSKGDELPVGENGEIIVRGPGVFKGYWNRPGATAISLEADGWFHTEDMGRLDLDGYLYGEGRLHDRINKGGFSVYPREVEEVINAHPTVKASAIVGEPDPTLGEEIVAYVVPREQQTVEEEEIIRYCSAHMARYKAPKKVITVECLPRSPNGALLRRALRNQGEMYSSDRINTISPAGGRTGG